MVEPSNYVCGALIVDLTMTVSRLNKAFLNYELAFVLLLIDLYKVCPLTSLKISCAAAPSEEKLVAGDPTGGTIFEISSILTRLLLLQYPPSVA